MTSIRERSVRGVGARDDLHVGEEFCLVELLVEGLDGLGTNRVGEVGVPEAAHDVATGEMQAFDLHAAEEDQFSRADVEGGADQVLRGVDVQRRQAGDLEIPVAHVEFGDLLDGQGDGVLLEDTSGLDGKRGGV